MSGDDGTLTVNLTLTGAPSAPRIAIVIEKTATPSQLREKAAEATKIPLSSIKLIFRGRLIANDDSKEVVVEYKLENDCVLHCMGKPVESATAAAATSNTPAAATSSTVAAGSSVSFLPQAAAAAPTNTTATTFGGGDSLQVALNSLRSSNSAADYLTAVTTLDKILSNCVEKPLEEKYRTVKRQNAAFQRRLGGIEGGHAAMLAAGFVVQGQGGDDEAYVLHASPEAWPKLVSTKAKVASAVLAAKSAAGATSAPPAVGAGFGGASMPPMGAGMPAGMGAGMPAGGVPPNMQNAMSNLMADPNALQAMMQVSRIVQNLVVIYCFIYVLLILSVSLSQNPMVQNMIQNDPRFANNPQMRQGLETLASNPQMLNQVSSMMRDPAMQAQMQSMMNAQGGMNMPAGMGAAPPANNTTVPNNNASGAHPANNNNGQNDQEMTEEEMIAEAIRRSLGEN